MDPDKAFEEYKSKNPEKFIHRMSKETRDSITVLEKDIIIMKKDMEYVRETVHDIRERLSNIHMEKDQEHQKIYDVINPMRDWQIKVGTKIAIWASIGTFVGTILSALIVWYITK